MPPSVNMFLALFYPVAPLPSLCNHHPFNPFLTLLLCQCIPRFPLPQHILMRKNEQFLKHMVKFSNFNEVQTDLLTSWGGFFVIIVWFNNAADITVTNDWLRKNQILPWRKMATLRLNSWFLSFSLNIKQLQLFIRLSFLACRPKLWTLFNQAY